MKYRCKKRKKFIKPILIFSLSLLFSIFFLVLFESILMPPLQEISHIQCKTTANTIIDQAVLEQLNTLDNNNLILYNQKGVTANTALVNHFCATLSTDINKRLFALPQENIHIPIGAALPLHFFANKGPSIPFQLVPMGNTEVDYVTEFTSAGINQINYKIWLEIDMEMKIVNPLYQETVQMHRKMMLVDLLLEGEVPEQFFQMGFPS